MIQFNFSFALFQYKTYMIDLLKIYWKLRLFHYGLFIGMMGTLASFFGPDRNNWIKLAIGVTIGCMLSGKGFINALKELFKWADEYGKDEK